MAVDTVLYRNLFGKLVDMQILTIKERLNSTKIQKFDGEEIDVEVNGPATGYFNRVHNMSLRERGRRHRVLLPAFDCQARPDDENLLLAGNN